MGDARSQYCRPSKNPVFLPANAPYVVIAGEQFKADIRNAESLASEMAAFANSEGGVIYIGVADDDSMPGLSRKDVTRVNQLN